MQKNDVGQRIRILRESQNYTREVFSEMIDISPKFLYEIETGRKGFSSEVLASISITLSVSSDYILFGTESVKSTEKILSVIEQFDNRQMGRLTDILQLIHEL